MLEQMNHDLWNESSIYGLDCIAMYADRVTLGNVRAPGPPGHPRGGGTDVRPEMAKVPQLPHIGEDADGELVFASANGSIFRAVPVADEPHGSPG